MWMPARLGSIKNCFVVDFGKIVSDYLGQAGAGGARKTVRMIGMAIFPWVLLCNIKEMVEGEW